MEGHVQLAAPSFIDRVRQTVVEFQSPHPAVPSAAPPSLTSFTSASTPAAASDEGPGTGIEHASSASTSSPQLTVAEQQARFRITGSGPPSGRGIEPVTPGAKFLLQQTPGAEDAVRGVLRLVEQVAGPDAASVPINGIALADDPQGHAANVVAAHVDDDQIFRSAIAGRSARGKQAALEHLTATSMAQVPSTKAMVTSGWMNLGPEATFALLASRGIDAEGRRAAPGQPLPGSTPDSAALAVRVIRHETQHLVDPSEPDLAPAAIVGLREAIAEAHSTRPEQLRAARAALGIAAADDDALQRSLGIRPYEGLERALQQALQASGVTPGSEPADQLLGTPGARGRSRAGPRRRPRPARARLRR